MDQRSKIAILGYGIEGKAMVNYLLEHEYHNLTVCDQNVDLKAEMPQGVSVNLGSRYLENLDEFDVIFRSPGIRYLDPHVQLAVQKDVEVSSPTQYFIDQCPCPIVGVTGTKGKGTTSTLIFEMLKRGPSEATASAGSSTGSARWKSGVNLFLGGNIGQCPMEFLDILKANSLVILELSSFQLQDLKKSPRYAVMLNTTSDHLDYHVDRDEYLQAKEKLLTGQATSKAPPGGRTGGQVKKSVAVLNKDYEYSKYYAPLVKGSLKWVSVKEKLKDGAYVYDGAIYYSKKGKSEKIAEVSEVALIGSHNLENILPALTIAKELGVSNEACYEVIKEFKNLPYRLQFTKEVSGIKFYNDSYSTTPETSMAAVDSFKEPTVLIAGGYDKGADYNDWAVRILTKPNLHTVILIGATSDKMEKSLIEAEDKLGEALPTGRQAQVYPTKILRRNSMEDAVVDAYAESDDGGIVVLSPAAASFDMFKNYKERGNEFVAQVRKLK